MTDDPRDGAKDDLFHKVIRHFLKTPAPRRTAPETGEPAEAPATSLPDREG